MSLHGSFVLASKDSSIIVTDCLHLISESGIATHFIPHQKWDEFRFALASPKSYDPEAIDKLIQSYSVPHTPGKVDILLVMFKRILDYFVRFHGIEIPICLSSLRILTLWTLY